MVNSILANRQTLKTVAALTLAISIVLFALALLLAAWWEISLLVSLEVASRFIYTLAGIFAIPACLYFLMSQKNNFTQFCDVYDNPDTQKHDPKVMFHSLIKYLAVIFIMTVIVTAPYGLGALLAPLFAVTVYLTTCIFSYIKLWKYHGYSVPLLLGLSGAAVIISVLLSPFIRVGAWAVIDAFLRVANII